MKRFRIAVSVSLLALAGAASAQVAPLKVPQQSQRATVSQTVGLTDVTINYGRPSVNGRKVWGGLVPYGEVWRAGANENTTITFSTDVTVGGTKLAAGTYGLHMIPTESEWTLILSREHEAWGSYDYEAKDDALRLKATPAAAASTEQLLYTFDDVTSDSAKATLRWEKLAVSLPIKVDTNAVVAESFRHQLKGAAQFNWQGWNQAAAWCLAHDTNLDEAMRWVDRSIGLAETFTNSNTKAGLLEKKGDAAGAAALRKSALAKATEVELNLYGYQLLGRKKVDEAIAIFEKNTKDHPDSWNTYDSLAEAYGAKGDKAKAISLYQKARAMVKAPDQQKRIDGEIAKLKG